LWPEGGILLLAEKGKKIGGKGLIFLDEEKNG